MDRLEMAYKGAMSSETSIHSDQHNIQYEVAMQKASIPATVKEKEAGRSSSSCTPVHEQSMSTIQDRLKDPPPPARATFLASFCRAIGWDYLPQRLHDLNTLPTEICDTSTVNISEKATRSTSSSSKQDKSTTKAKSPQTSAQSLCHGKENDKGQMKRHYSLRARLKGIWKTASPNTEKQKMR
ncbi:hypothetical protein N7493_003030 [Penicillium malachiteum]|uniref:Uncharacterized protein n=1 Tax=Penicillium malachiteum TaxID=1324776 RepID=A0AAD6MZ82_9EURO|nr:hypothetical protein N7493_003030 [Penicillium malachiteum]